MKTGMVKRAQGRRPERAARAPADRATARRHAARRRRRRGANHRAAAPSSATTSPLWPKAPASSARIRSATWPHSAATWPTPRRRPTWRRRCWPGRRAADRRPARPATRPVGRLLPRRPPHASWRPTKCWSRSSSRAPAPGSGGTYVRHTPRRELDIAVVGVASQLTMTRRALRQGAHRPRRRRARAAARHATPKRDSKARPSRRR